MPLREARPRARRPLGPVLLLLAACVGLGCATIEHGLEVSKYAGRTLNTRQAEGAERLRAELEIDVTLRDFVEKYGRPDYLHVVDRMNLYFFYVGDDMAARFERDLIPPSEAQRLGRIPGSLIDLLPKREVDKLLARRAAAKRQYARRAPKTVHRAAPAAPAPSYSINRFNVAKVVSHLRSPLTAADAGVGGWRKARFADGGMGQTTKVRGIRYEVRGDRLVVALPIASGRTRPPGHARIEVLRLNGAIFGAHAQAVTDQVMPLVAKAAADRSGRSPMSTRVRGRMVRVDRIPSQGLLVYAIRP